MSLRSAVVWFLACGVFAVVVFRPIRDVDMFWQVRTGELMLETGQLVTTDPFTSTHTGEPTPTIYWLSQLLYAAVLKVGSWELLHRLDAALFALALALAGFAAGTPRDHPLATAAAFALAFLIALPHHGLRPQTFGLLGFALIVLLTRSNLSPLRKVVLTFVVCVLWQNLHPSATIAVLYLGVLAAAALIHWWKTGDRPYSAFGMLVAAGLAVFATPDGFGVLKLSAENAAVSKAIGIEEWLPIWHEATWPASRMVWVGMLVSLGLMVFLRRRVGADELAIALVFGGLAAVVYRVSLFWAVAMIPIWARWIEDAVPMLQREEVRKRISPAVAGLVAMCAALVPMIARPPVFDKALPFAGLDRLRELRVSGTVYNYREWGGPLIAKAHPNVRVTIDGRLFLFPPQDWDDYVRVALGQVPLDEVEARYRPAAFFLRPSYHATFIDAIRQSGRWDEVHTDDYCVLFVKPDPQLVLRQRQQP